ncbi:MAG: nitroreductase family protein [Desulfuromonadaceae bacterium]|nr:nitroreductase family protein [Desulfuromonadaceae bacterium]
MDFAHLITYRQSIRRYSDRLVESEKLDRLVEAVRLAPSACNAQPWTLLLVDEPSLRTEVAKATFSKALSFNRFALQAPLLAVLVLEPPPLTVRLGALVKGREFPLIDIGIAAAQLCLQAAELGLGSCMLGWFDERKVKRLLNIPHRRRIGLVITLGYAAPDYPDRSKQRKPTAAMSGRNDYRNKAG